MLAVDYRERAKADVGDGVVVVVVVVDERNNSLC
jgi:hypothetical protein